MVGYSVYRNDQRLCAAGVGAFGVLTACVTWAASSPERVARQVSEGESAQEPVTLTLQVNVLKNQDASQAVHLCWIDASLRVGDEIRIQIVDTSQVDPALTERREDPAKDLDGKKRYVRRLARELGWQIRESSGSLEPSLEAQRTTPKTAR